MHLNTYVMGLGSLVFFNIFVLIHCFEIRGSETLVGEIFNFMM